LKHIIIKQSHSNNNHIPKLIKPNNNFEAHNNDAITFYMKRIIVETRGGEAEGNRAQRRAAAEVPGIERSSGGGGDWRRRWRRRLALRAAERRPHGGDFRVFLDESQTTRCGLLFIGSKILEADLKLELLLIVLKLIISSSTLKPLLMMILSAVVRN
jgi:hypothetical protein